ncbi:MAG: VOC family protein [Flavobacterium sp.]|nr:VOC family protein [Flavobacterium sp.]
MKIPAQYNPVMPYLIVNDSIAFLEFAKSTFGATEQFISRLEDNRIQHGEIRIHDAVIMFSQANDNWGAKTAGMFVYVDNVDKVYKAALHHGAVSLMPPAQQDYGYTGGFEDPNGNHWWIVEGESI